MTFRLMRCAAATVVLRRTGCAAARMTSTPCGRVTTARVAARTTSTRCGRMTTAWVATRTTTAAPTRMAAAGVTARMRCGSISVRGSTTGTTAMGFVVPDVGTAATRTPVRGSRSRATAVHRSRVMRYRTTMRPTRRASVGAARRSTVRTTLGTAMRTTESMRRHDATARELTGARRRRHSGMTVVE